MIRRLLTIVTILCFSAIFLIPAGCQTESAARLTLDAPGCTNVGDLKWVEGKSGRTPAFDGKGYIVIPHCSKFHSPQHTITAWVKLKDSQDFQYILWKAGPDFPEQKNLRRMDIWVHIDGQVEGILDNAEGTEDRARLTGRTRITNDKWHFIAWVYDGKSAILYVDGQEDGKIDLPKPLAKNEFPIWVGARPGNIAATGLIDKLCYYTKALRWKEIVALYKAGQ